MMKVLKFKLNKNSDDKKENLLLEISDSSTISMLAYSVLAVFNLIDKKPFIIKFSDFEYFDSDSIDFNNKIKLKDINFQVNNLFELIYNSLIKIIIEFDSIRQIDDLLVFNYPKIVSNQALPYIDGLKYNTMYKVLFWDLKFGYEILRKEKNIEK